ncbi:MAG: glycosyltransferase family A protein [Armatimonadota bacterium]|nr:glycosyltransferase family A protein [Armatimonadota bacterium]MDR7443526.1 glycosyltransferase family A protein [Armatimonadota bacterium]MDR7570359.1 glycosyltransferase family A protein [Armatimonadota bacterium]MDR7615025.1 glycosyltransferase family A protein [Armatimonadota bacterium]
MPTVSLVIPAYNAEASLREALDSVFAQSRLPDEVVVVDDGSTDRTAEIAASYGDRVCLVRQPNRGEAAARNTGVRSARGELVAFLDADDLWLPGYLASQLRVYEASGGGCLVFCDAWVEGRRTQDGAGPFDESDPVLSIVRGFPIPMDGVLVPREALLRADLFPEGLRWGPDVSLLLKLARSGAPFRRNPEPLVVYRRNPRSLSNTRRRESTEHLLRSLHRLSRDPELPAHVRRAARDRAAALHRRFWFLAREMLVAGEVEEARGCAALAFRLRPQNPAYAAVLALSLIPKAILRLARRRRSVKRSDEFVRLEQDT